MFNRVGVPNAFCLKSSAILALCTMHLEHVQLVIGLEKEHPSKGHAWVERNNEIISNDTVESVRQYLVIKRINF